MSQAENPKQEVSAHGGVRQLLDPAVYERIMLAATHQEPDRVPIWDYIDSWPVFQHFAPEQTDPLAANRKVFHGLGIDLCRGLPMPTDPESEGHQAPDGSYTVSGHTRWGKRPIKTLQDIRDWQGDVISEQQAWREARHILHIMETMAPHTMYVPGGPVGVDTAYVPMGLELFSLALHDDPDAVERMIDTINSSTCVRAKVYAQADICPLFFVWADIAYKGSTMFSHDTLHRIFFPYLRRICEPLVDAGILPIFHTDGYIMDIVDDLLDCGVAGLNPLEPLAGNDIAALKKRYGDRLILVGGIDCSQLLPYGSVRDIRQGVRRLLRDAGHGGGLFIGSSSEVVPATPIENIFAFYEACHELGQYPLDV